MPFCPFFFFFFFFFFLNKQRMHFSAWKSDMMARVIVAMLGPWRAGWENISNRSPESLKPLTQQQQTSTLYSCHVRKISPHMFKQLCKDALWKMSIWKGECFMHIKQASHTSKIKLKWKWGYNIGAPGWLIWLGIQLLVSAQVMISRFVSSSPA